MGKQRWSAFGPLKRAVKKINFLLSFNFRKWRLASILSIASSSSSRRTRRLSFNDRIGLHGAIEDVESDHQKYKPVRTFERVRSYGSSDEDIDKRAEIFINNFRQQLLIERQVSLQLRYYRGNSFGRDYWRECQYINKFLLWENDVNFLFPFVGMQEKTWIVVLSMIWDSSVGLCN